MLSLDRRGQAFILRVQLLTIFAQPTLLYTIEPTLSDSTQHLQALCFLRSTLCASTNGAALKSLRTTVLSRLGEDCSSEARRSRLKTHLILRSGESVALRASALMRRLFW